MKNEKPELGTFPKNTNEWKSMRKRLRILEELGRAKSTNLFGEIKPQGFRFNELHEISGMSKRTLSKHLKRLVDGGFVRKKNSKYYISDEGAKELCKLKELVNIIETPADDFNPIDYEANSIQITGISTVVKSVGKNEDSINISIPRSELERNRIGSLVLTWKKNVD